MTLKQRIFLVSAVCIIFGGLLVSYKSFELNSKTKIQSENEKSIEVAQWVAQSIEQKIIHLESSVSYLDASTIETLKRMGARYFAYAYSKDGQWKIKWKELGALDRKGILKEVNGLSFDSIPASRRSWSFNGSGDQILISPVELAGSHQLKNGFLIFGLNEEFFSFIGGVDNSVSIVTLDKKALYTQAKNDIKTLTQELEGVEAKVLDIAGESKILSSFFSKPSQLWIARAQSYKAASYLGSSTFSYFLLAIVLSMAFLAMMVQRFLSEVVEAKNATVGKSFSLGAFREKSLGLFARTQKRTEDSLEESSLMEKDAVVEAVQDFSGFLDDIVALERTELKKQKISVKTQVEEGASVICAPQHITDFLRRLISNSIKSLKGESEKRIQIELVKQGQNYQMIYVDTRRNHYPTGDEPSLFLQDESSLEHIDGLISYGSWLFGDRLEVAKDGFCISIDLQKAIEEDVSAPIFIEEEEAVVENRIEIDDEDLMDIEFGKVESSQEKLTLPEASEPVQAEGFSSQSIEDIVESFEMKNFTFDSTEGSEETENELESETPVDDKGMFEFNTGDFKIKIRSPKGKRDSDVHS